MYAKRTCRQRNTISYKFEDFDDMINSAIKEEVEEVKVHKAEYKRTNYGLYTLLILYIAFSSTVYLFVRLSVKSKHNLGYNFF